MNITEAANEGLREVVLNNALAERDVDVSKYIGKDALVRKALVL